MKKLYTVAVLGATGAMGRYLTPKLAERGYQVDAVSLDSITSDKPNLRYIQTKNAMDPAFVDEIVKNRYDAVVDFMIYNSVSFRKTFRKYCENAGQYIYTSSCRVYANEENPIVESSPRLLDVTTDEKLLFSDDYCMHKARAEDLLWSTDYNNFTIVRPATTFSEMRYQLVTLEAKDTVGRARKGKKVVVPIQAKDKPATLCWGGDVAKMIARLMFKPETMREAYNVCSSESRTWGEIADYYKQLCGLEAVWVDKEDYLKILNPAVPNAARWQLEYARLFRRITDNIKMLSVTGLKQSDFMTLYDALKMMIDAVPEGYEFPDTDAGRRMDAYLEEHGL